MAVVINLQREGRIPDLAAWNDAQMASVMNDIGRAILNLWMGAVSGNLLPGMTKPVESSRYLRGLSTGSSLAEPVVRTGNLYSSAVAWVGPAEASNRQPLPLLIEHGYDAFDLKPGLLAGPKARQGKEGPYNIVPFRHMGPSSTGRYAQRMPAWAHALAQKLRATTTKPGGGHQWGGRLTETPREDARFGDVLLPAHRAIRQTKSPFDLRRERAHGTWPVSGGRSVMAGPYTWKHPIQEGMVRMEQPTKGAPQSFYMTFRTVSGRSDPSSWIHPGMLANPVMAAVVRESVNAVTAIFESRGVEFSA